MHARPPACFSPLLTLPAGLRVWCSWCAGGDTYDGADASFALLQYGQTQAGNAVSFPPHLLARLLEGLALAAARAIGSAGSSGSGGGGFDTAQLPAVLDIGAGYGLASLAAASRGHPVVAFEAAPKSAAALAASIAYNGFPVRMQQAALGEAAEQVCLDAADAAGLTPAQQEAAEHGYADGAAAAARRLTGCARQAQRLAAADAVAAALPKGVTVLRGKVLFERCCLTVTVRHAHGAACARVRPDLCASCAAPPHPPPLRAPPRCHAGAHIGAVRVRAHGRTAQVVRALEPLLLFHRPHLLMLEWVGEALDGDEQPDRALAPLLLWLLQRGWGRVTHAGAACRKQWEPGEVALQHRWPEAQPLDLAAAIAGECALFAPFSC